MATLHAIIRWVEGTVFLPGTIWLVSTAKQYFNEEPQSEKRRKLLVPLAALLLLGIFQIVYGILYSVRWGFDVYLTELLLLSLFLGVPLTALTVFLPAVIRYRRCPKDSPERVVYTRKLRTTAVICGILVAVFVVFIVWFMIGIAHM